MLNETDNDCSKSVTVSANSAVLNSSASSVCVSVKQRSSAADCCGVRCKSRAIVAQTAGIVGFMVGNIAHCKITPTLSACIAQMVGTLKTQCSTVCRHYPTLRTSCCRISGSLDAVVAHRVFRLMQIVDTLRQSRHAKELQIRLVRFDSGPRLHRLVSHCPSGEIGRHIGLKIRRFVNNGRTGSIPVSGTNYTHR